jgi:hypothetical protein
MYTVCNKIIDKFVYYVNLGYGHADEQLYSPVYFENKNLFEHYFGDYTEMITNYKYVRDRPDQIVNIFIYNSYLHKDYKKCEECCKFLLNSLCKNKCKMDKQNIKILYEYLIALNNVIME